MNKEDSILTEDENDLLASLMQWGFYDSPARITVQEAAVRLDISVATLLTRIESITDTLFREYMRRAFDKDGA